MDQEWYDWRKRCDESRSGNGSRLRPRFDQDGVAEAESLRLFEEYFAIFPWQSLPQYAVGSMPAAAAGGGPHRWRRGTAICTAWMRVPGFDGCKRKLAGQANVSFYKASLDAMPLADCGVDFGYSLGVLRHLPLKP
jgi:hypothetical protein